MKENVYSPEQFICKKDHLFLSNAFNKELSFHKAAGGRMILSVIHLQCTPRTGKISYIFQNVSGVLSNMISLIPHFLFTRLFLCEYILIYTSFSLHLFSYFHLVISKEQTAEVLEELENLQFCGLDIRTLYLIL